MKIFLVIVAGWSVRLIINVYYLLKTIELKDKYVNYWKGEVPNAQIYTPEIKKVFFKAGINNYYFSFLRPLDFGHHDRGVARIFDNLFYRDKENIINIISLFEQTMGVFRSRIIENFNPIFWIEFIIFLPRNILDYIGVNSQTFSTFSQVIYWIFAFFYSVYNDQINEIIQNLLSNLFK